MFGRLFRKLQPDTELTNNPELIFDQKITAQDFRFFGIKIGDNQDLIDRSKIIHTTFEPMHPDAKNGIWKNGRTYYKDKKGQELEYFLEDRIEAIHKQGFGNLFTAEGPYVIKNRIVVGFAINNNGRLDNFYKNIPMNKIQLKFGKPNEIIAKPEPVDHAFTYFEYKYPKREMRVFFDDWDKCITNIVIGKSQG